MSDQKSTPIIVRDRISLPHGDCRRDSVGKYVLSWAANLETTQNQVGCLMMMMRTGAENEKQSHSPGHVTLRPGQPTIDQVELFLFIFENLPLGTLRHHMAPPAVPEMSVLESQRINA